MKKTKSIPRDITPKQKTTIKDLVAKIKAKGGVIVINPLNPKKQ